MAPFLTVLTWKPLNICSYKRFLIMSYHYHYGFIWCVHVSSPYMILRIIRKVKKSEMSIMTNPARFLDYAFLRGTPQPSKCKHQGKGNNKVGKRTSRPEFIYIKRGNKRNRSLSYPKPKN